MTTFGLVLSASSAAAAVVVVLLAVRHFARARPGRRSLQSYVSISGRRRHVESVDGSGFWTRWLGRGR